MKNLFFCFFLISFCFSYTSFAAGHDAYACFNFYNSLKRKAVTLKMIGEPDMSVEGSKIFPETIVLPQGRFFLEEELRGYQENLRGELPSIMLTIGVYVEDNLVGIVELVRTGSPDPSFFYSTEKNNLGLELRIQPSRFGGGKRTLEVAPKSRLQR